MNTRRLAGYNGIDELSYAYQLLQTMIQEISTILIDYEVTPEEAEKLDMAKARFQNFLEKYPEYYLLTKKINDELLSTENVEYSMKHRVFPEHASSTYDIVDKELQECFSLEDDLAQSVIARIWREETDKDVNYRRGEEFCHVFHSGYGEVILPGSTKYRENPYSNTAYVSCSLVTGRHMDLYNSSTGIEFHVDPEAFVCASFQDCATREITHPNLHTVKEVIQRNGTKQYIQAGHFYGDIIATRLLTPKAIERKCVENAQKICGGILGIDSQGNETKGTIINEVVLDKTKAKPKSAFIRTTGCEFLFDEYAQVQKMAEAYGVPIKIINRSVYRQKQGLEPFTLEEKNEFYRQLTEYWDVEKTLKERLLTTTPASMIQFLKGYQQDVIEQAGYDEKMKKHMNLVVERMLEFTQKEQDKRKKTNHDEFGK